MQRSEVYHRGFTLLELLVVLFIIGIIVSLAVPSIGGGGADRIAHEEMKRIQKLIDLAQQESVLSFQEYGVVFSPSEYEFMLLNKSEQWQSVSGDDLFRRRLLPEGFQFSLQVEGRGVDLRDGSRLLPHIVLSSNGERTPFELKMTGTATFHYRLKGAMVGPLVLEDLGV